MSRIILIAGCCVVLMCAGCGIDDRGPVEKPNSRKLVTLNGEYGYIGWNGDVKGGFYTLDAARQGMIEAREISENYDANRYKKNPKYWEEVN